MAMLDGRVERTATELKGGDKYTGQWKGNVFDGKGVLEWPNGANLSGQWKDGAAHGELIFNYANGDWYSGQWVRNQANGTGTYEHKRGGILVTCTGQWEDSCISGHCVEKWQDGRYFEGNFVKGRKTGFGKLVWTDNSLCEGEVVDNYTEGKGVHTRCDGRTYTGQWLNGKMHGQGKTESNDGHYYEGGYLNGKREGYGVCTWRDGKKYDGEWKNGSFHGKGCMISKSGNSEKWCEWAFNKTIRDLTENEVADRKASMAGRDVERDAKGRNNAILMHTGNLQGDIDALSNPISIAAEKYLEAMAMDITMASTYIIRIIDPTTCPATTDSHSDDLCTQDSKSVLDDIAVVAKAGEERDRGNDFGTSDTVISDVHLEPQHSTVPIDAHFKQQVKPKAEFFRCQTIYKGVGDWRKQYSCVTDHTTADKVGSHAHLGSQHKDVVDVAPSEPLFMVKTGDLPPGSTTARSIEPNNLCTHDSKSMADGIAVVEQTDEGRDRGADFGTSDTIISNVCLELQHGTVPINANFKQKVKPVEELFCRQTFPEVVGDLPAQDSSVTDHTTTAGEVGSHVYLGSEFKDAVDIASSQKPMSMDKIGDLPAGSSTVQSIQPDNLCTHDSKWVLDDIAVVEKVGTSDTIIFDVHLEPEHSTVETFFHCQTFPEGVGDLHAQGSSVAELTAAADKVGSHAHLASQYKDAVDTVPAEKLATSWPASPVRSIEPMACPPTTDDYSVNLCTQDSKSVSGDTAIIEKAAEERDRGSDFGTSDTIISDVHLELQPDTVPIDANFKQQVKPMEECFRCQPFPEGVSGLCAQGSSVTVHTTTAEVGSNAHLGSQCKVAVDIAPRILQTPGRNAQMRMSTCWEFLRGQFVATRAASQVPSISVPKPNAVAPSEKPISMDKPDDLLAGSTTVTNIEPTVCPPSTDGYRDNFCTQDSESVSDDVTVAEKVGEEKDGGTDFGTLDTITSDVHLEPLHSTVPIDANLKQQVKPMEEFFGCHTFPGGVGDLHADVAPCILQTQGRNVHMRLSTCSQFVRGRVVATRAASQVPSISAPKPNAIAPSKKQISMDKPDDLLAGSTTVKNIEPTVCPPSTDDYSDNLCTQDGKSVSDDIALVEKAGKERDGGNNFGPLDTITSDVHVEPPQSTVPIDANFKQQVQPMEEFFGCHTFPKGAGDLHEQDSSVTEQTTAADTVGSHAQLGSLCKDAVDIVPSEKPMSMEKIGDLPAGSTTVRSIKTQRAVHTGDVLGNAGGDVMTLESNLNISTTQTRAHDNLSNCAVTSLPCLPWLYAFSSALECLTPVKHFPVQIVNSFGAGLAMLSAQEVRIGFSACLAAIGFGCVLTAPKQLPFWLTFLGGMTEMKLCLDDNKDAPPILQTPGNHLFSQENIISQARNALVGLSTGWQQFLSERVAARTAASQVPAAPVLKQKSMDSTSNLLAGSIGAFELDLNRSAKQITSHDYLSSCAVRCLPSLYAFSGALEWLAPAKHFPVQSVYCFGAGLAVLSTQNVRIGSLGAHFLAVMGFGGVLTAPRHLPFWLTFLCAMTEYKLCLVDDKEAPPILQTTGNQLFSQESTSSQVPAAAAPKQSNEVERSAAASSSTDTTSVPDDASVDSRRGWRRQLLTVAGWITNWTAK